MKDVMEFIKSALILAAVVLILGSCSEQDAKERESKIEAARKEAYNEGYDAGYRRGSEDQALEDFERLTIDTYSIRDISDKVYEEYEMTPYEAFSIYDEYTYDSTHGGFTWKEYQKALEAMYYTASIFPYDY